MISEVSQNSLQERVKLCRLLALHRPELACRSSSRGFVACVKESKQPIQAGWSWCLFTKGNVYTRHSQERRTRHANLACSGAHGSARCFLYRYIGQELSLARWVGVTVARVGA